MISACVVHLLHPDADYLSDHKGSVWEGSRLCGSRMVILLRSDWKVLGHVSTR